MNSCYYELMGDHGKFEIAKKHLLLNLGKAYALSVDGREIYWTENYNLEHAKIK